MVAELEAARAKLADATAAMQDAHEQLSELQVRSGLGGRMRDGSWGRAGGAGELAQCLLALR